jgi:hypothetical protein
MMALSATILLELDARTGDAVEEDAAMGWALRMTSAMAVLDRFVYDPDTHQGDVAISFAKGAFRCITGEIKNKQNVTLRTPTASMVIRGTELVLLVLPDGTTGGRCREWRRRPVRLRPARLGSRRGRPVLHGLVELRGRARPGPRPRGCGLSDSAHAHAVRRVGGYRDRGRR